MIPPVLSNNLLSVISNNMFLVLLYSSNFKILIVNSSTLSSSITVRIFASPVLTFELFPTSNLLSVLIS